MALCWLEFIQHCGGAFHCVSREIKIQRVSMSKRLEGKFSLVTGASKGIGRAIATRFAKEGSTVAITARNSIELDALANEIADAGGMAVPFAGDIGSDDFIRKLFAEVEKQFGRLDILINNAGIVDGNRKDMDTLTPEKFREVMNVNVVSVFHCMQQAIRIMKANGDVGKIINLGSVRSHWTESGEPGAYNASKYAVKGLTETVARLMIEQKSNIAVGMVCPGIVNTPIHVWSKPDDPERLRWMQPETIAEAVMHAVTAPPNISVYDTIIFPTCQLPF